MNKFHDGRADIRVDATNSPTHRRDNPRPELSIQDLGIDVHGPLFIRIDPGLDEHDKAERAETEQLKLCQDMTGIIRMVVHLERQKRVERAREDANQDAEHGPDRHRHQHVLRRFLGADP